MKKATHFNIAILCLLILPQLAWSQNEPDDASRSQIMDAARALISEASTCALITLDENQRPMVRAMDAFLPEPDFTVWFGTNPMSRKVTQIRHNPEVTLYYLGNEDSGYVVSHGQAELIDDQSEKNQRWKEEWKAFYPDQTDNYLLIKVSPQSMEVVSYPHGLLGDSITWLAPTISFDRN